MFGSLRVVDEDEIDGLDLSEHSESAYGFAGGGVSAAELGQGAHVGAISMAPAHERVA